MADVDPAITAAHNAIREMHANVDGGCVCAEPWAHIASLKFVAARALEAARPLIEAETRRHIANHLTEVLGSYENEPSSTTVLEGIEAAIADLLDGAS